MLEFKLEVTSKLSVFYNKLLIARENKQFYEIYKSFIFT